MTGSAARSSKILGTLPVAVAPAAAPVAGRSPLPLHCRRRRTVGRDGAPCRHGRRAPCSGDSPAPAVAPPRSGWSVAAAGPRPHRWWPAASRSAAGCNAPGARTSDCCEHKGHKHTACRQNASRNSAVLSSSPHRDGGAATGWDHPEVLQDGLHFLRAAGVVWASAVALVGHSMGLLS